MKVKLTILLAAMSLMAFSAAAFASNYTQADAGEAVITGANEAGGALSFSPSPNVYMSGASVEQAFAVQAYHAQAVGRSDGKAYGMASDATDVFWYDISTAAPANLTGTNSSAFDTGWNTF